MLVLYNGVLKNTHTDNTMIAPPQFSRSKMLMFLGGAVLLSLLSVGIVSGRTMLLNSKAADATQTVTFVIQNKMDVMNQDGTEILATPDIAWIGNGRSTTQSALGLRFTGPGIPAGSAISSARIDFTSSKNQWIAIAAAFAAEDTVAPQYYGIGDTLIARLLLPDSPVLKNNSRWAADKTYSFDVTPAVKAHYQKYGSVSSLSMVVKGRGKEWGRKYFYANPAFGKSPTLTVKYTSATASPVSTPAPSATPVPTATPAVSPSPTPTATPMVHPSPTASPISGTGGNSMAMGRWTPAPQDSCTQLEHDSYFKIGPDGKKYPTWHPPVHKRDNGTTCTFGHEHGRDPAGSELLTAINQEYGGILFGYGNEKLDEYNTANGITNGMRHEDHVGHKIEWENNLVRRVNNCANTPASPGCFDTTATNVTCDFLMKVHQGTHSPDAFANNVHELTYAISCTDGTKLISTKMVPFGKPGEFVDNDGKSRVVTVGSPVPTNSPTGDGVRFIPTNVGVSNQILVPQGKWSLYSNGLYEDWLSSNYLRRTGSDSWLAYFDPHFAVFGPSRYHDPSAPGMLRRSIEVCYLTENNGTERARGGECDSLTNYGQNMTPIAYDDPRSPFNGVKREFYFNNTGINNPGGPTAWYTDPYGGNARTTPAPGFIRHFIAAVDNRSNPIFESQAIGGDRWYGGQGVHAPN